MDTELQIYDPENGEVQLQGSVANVVHKETALKILLKYNGLYWKAFRDELALKKAGDKDAIIVHPHTIERWLQEDPAFEYYYRMIKQIVLDENEWLLHECALDKNITAIIYKLNNQGAARGYMPPAVLANNTVINNEIQVKAPAPKPKK